MQTLKNRVGRNIKSLRKTRDLTQEDLAYRAKIEPRRISLIESGKANPTLDTMYRLATALGVDASILFGRNLTFEWDAREERIMDEYRQMSEKDRLFIETTITHLLEKDPD
ncbi:helix-turn-helix domain-containing protein [Neobittarella massiliensis]|uniref:Helix-turn-helix transcriptional regulator n=2 Tax=Oscillospiraceae TaxID=216572 RepID=A0A8J6LTU6_9FIRM|nr:helix-turn-helix transcriptional regulator [Neobittarella massiliensis]MBC3514905.1 helix-turn-helix transcriptional regulator [Neobittarella massiliensis]SCJ69725.1 anaerobic benzoate catabolism transcriptional regulator [uncultured Anaerotruncus sp.]